jgi:iron complex outermembrane receptor protein
VLAPAMASSADAATMQEAARGQLTIIVTDAMHARVAGATVTVSRGTERHTATAGADGVARLANLGGGMWTVTVTSPGFARWQQGVVVDAGAIEVAAVLAVEGLTETIEVVSEAGEPTQIPLNAIASGGTRLDLAVRDLPASLFMVGQQLIQDRGARSVEEAVQLAVGMIASTGVGSIPSYQTRGWSSSNVAVMRDGIRQNTASQSSRPVDSFILDRIEILKGPASLLYGEGSIGGAVNMVSKSAMSELNISTLLSYGSFGSYRAGLGVNVPVRRNLFARVDVSRTGTDGYVKNSPQQLNAAAGSLRWLPTPNAVITGRATYTYDNTSAYYATPFINGGFDRRTRDINYNMEDRLTKSHNRWAQAEADLLLARGWRLHNQLFAATHKLDWRNFEGYTYNPATNKVDVTSYFLIWRDDLLVGNRFDARNTVQVAGRTVNFLVGGEVQRNDMDRAGTPVGTSLRRSLDLYNPEPHFDPGLSYEPQRQVLINTRGMFAEAVVDATDRLKLVSGLRWEVIGLEYTPYSSFVTASTDYTPVTGRLGVVFEVTPNANVYGSFSRAVEPTTQLASLDGSLQQFSLVPGRQYEVGAKGSALRGRLEGTVAYFDIEKRDLLITSLIDGIRTNQQVGRQSSRGVELAIVAKPFDSLTISGDVAVTGARFDDFVEIISNQNLSRTGNTPPGVPAVLWNLSPTQRIGRLDLTATLRQVGERWGDNANSRRVGSYTTVDAAAGVRLGRGSRVTVRGRNLTDRIYTQSTSSTAGRLEPPRGFDVTFTTDF